MQSARKPAAEINTQVTIPDNAGYTWLFDSTDPRRFKSVALGKTAGVRAPMADRGGAEGQIALIGASCTGQNVNLVAYTLDGNGAWQLYSSVTITAGASPQFVDWTISAPDVLIGFLAGASAPSDIITTLLLLDRA
jgi:hypothetical protein